MRLTIDLSDCTVTPAALRLLQDEVPRRAGAAAPPTQRNQDKKDGFR